MNALSRRSWLRQSGLILSSIPLMSSYSIEGELFSNDSIVRLGSNENPYGPSKKSLEAMTNILAASNRYGSDSAGKLRDAVAKKHTLTREHVILGAGSSELLGLTAQLGLLRGKELIAPNPTFKLWLRAAEKIGLTTVSVQTGSDKQINLSDIARKISNQTAVIYLCNPNNPTGLVIKNEELRNFIQNTPRHCLLLIDEAYLEYTNSSSVADMTNSYPNLIVAKTFSKIYGLAGARIGYAVAHPDTVKQLNELQPWNNNSVSTPSLEAAHASLSDTGFIQETTTLNAEARSYFESRLAKLNIPFIKSETNFMYCSFQSTSKDVIKEMASRKFRIGPQFETEGNWIRISIGTKSEMERAANELTTILS